MNGKTAIGGVVIFALGVGAGMTWGKMSVQRQDEPTPTADVSAADEQIAKLNRRIAELEAAAKAKAEKQSEVAVQQETPEPAPKVAKADEDEEQTVAVSIDGEQDVVAQLEKQLPAEQFGQVTNAFARMKQARERAAKGKLEYLSSIDTSKMTSEELKTHQKFLQLVAKQQEIAGNMKGLIPDQQSLQQMVGLQIEMKSVANAERKVLLNQMCGELGYTGDDAAVVTDTVGDIVGATSAGGINDILGVSLDDIGVGVEVGP